jgi:hypothetical protein
MAQKKRGEFSGYAIAGFVLSLIGPLFIFGIIFSAIGLSKTKNDKKRGRGLAIAGLIISMISFLAMIVFIVSLSFLNLNSDSLKVNIEGISETVIVEYPNQNITLDISGINNNVTVNKDTNVVLIKDSGMKNKITLCRGIHIPKQMYLDRTTTLTYVDC